MQTIPEFSFRALKFAALLLVLIVLSPGCKENPLSQDAGSSEEAVAALEINFEKLKKENPEVVDFRVLKDALPEKLLGMPRVSHNGQKSGAVGVNVSFASADYKEEDKAISISISDAGSAGSAISSLAGLAGIDVDKETEEGYERMTTIGGQKIREKFNRVTGEGEIAMIAADRFIIVVSGTQLKDGELVKALEKINLKI